MMEAASVLLGSPMNYAFPCVLATSGQPFAVGDSTNSGLIRYRAISLKYRYSVDGVNDGCIGLPGRAVADLHRSRGFGKFPEWTPNVQYYSSKEFPQLDHALNYNIRGTFALPVFERENCVGVLELVMTSQKINYAPDFDKVCKALEATNLKSTGTFDHQDTWTWLPQRHQNGMICGKRFSVLTCVPSLAFYATDARMWSFQEACLEHHLQDEQGLPGRAFSSLNACFCVDISLFRKSDYPLVHYVRMFGLQSSLTIPLRFSPVPELKSQTMETTHGLETSQSGLVSKEQDFSLQQRSECDVALLKVSDAIAENITFSTFEKDGKMTLQFLKQLFGKNLNDAANCLGNLNFRSHRCWKNWKTRTTRARTRDPYAKNYEKKEKRVKRRERTIFRSNRCAIAHGSGVDLGPGEYGAENRSEEPSWLRSGVGPRDRVSFGMKIDWRPTIGEERVTVGCLDRWGHLGSQTGEMA
ncbi:putative signal recognition particle 19 kDa protein-like [Capsicum annuum]|nr:putative signal recognition particle 19 kDa protein-like [Capsicum annuum]